MYSAKFATQHETIPKAVMLAFGIHYRFEIEQAHFSLRAAFKMRTLVDKKTGTLLRS